MNLDKFNQKITTKVVCMIALLLWGGVTGGSLVIAINTSGHSQKFIVLGVFILLVLNLIVIRLLSKYLTVGQLIAVVLTISFVIKLVWVLKVPTQPSSDFLVLHNAAMQASRGDFSFMQNNYFKNWPYQLGFVLYQAIIIKFLGQSLMIIKITNIILSLGIAYLTFLICKQLFNKKVGLIGLSIMALYPQYIFYSSVLTNQYIATFCFYFGFYILVKYNQWFLYVLGGVFLGLGNVVRPLGPLVLIAVLLFIAFYKNNRVYYGKWITKIILIFSLVGGYQIVTIGTNLVIQTTGISQYGLINRSPTWKFVTGLNYETTGSYSDKDLKVLNQYPIGKKRDRVGKKIIKERITDKFKLIKLFIKKSLVMWSYRDSALEWSNFKEFVSTNMYQGALLYQTIFYTLILTMAILGIIIVMVQNKNQSMLFIIIMIGYFLVHWLIEIQTRYRFFIIPAIVILSAVGVMNTYIWLKKKIRFSYVKMH